MQGSQKNIEISGNSYVLKRLKAMKVL